MSAIYYITTPIYYVNDKPHIGHAYTSIAADVLARFKRMDGYEVLFTTGTDEHGQKIAKAAWEKNISPQAFCDEVSKSFQDLTPLLNLSNDIFIRTTQNHHQKAAQYLWQELQDKGHIYKGCYKGWYAVRDEAYYGADELIDGKAPTGADVEWIEEDSYFFNLSQWQQPLLDFYKQHPDFIKPQGRFNEVIKFVEGGLHDLSISRSTFKWGVPVPHDSDHVMYVWIDALVNYLSVLGYPHKDTVKTHWPHAIHMVGKDILRFHGVYWPAFLMAAGLTPPQRIMAHGWWTINGQKMSKSLKNTIDPVSFVKTHGVDALRYYLMREAPMGHDGNFSHETFIQRYNADLANDLGNLSQRVLSFVHKNACSHVPTPDVLTKEDHNLLHEAKKCLTLLRRYADQQAHSRMLEAIWRLISLSNKYVDEMAPWHLKKTDTQRMETVLYVLLDVLRMIGLYILPFMPQTATTLLNFLSVKEDERTFLKHPPLKPHTPLPAPVGLFPRIQSSL